MNLQQLISKSVIKGFNRVAGRSQRDTQPTPISEFPAPTTSDPLMKPYFDQLPRRLKAYRNDLFGETGPVLWLDQENYLEQIEAKVQSSELTLEDARLCEAFAEDGFVIVKGLISESECDAAWEGFMRDWKAGRFALGPEPRQFDAHWGRVGNIHHYVKEMHELLHHNKITRLTDMFMGRKTIPYQTIPSFYGSEQKPHSDAIHMTTFPLGFMSAAWIALEDIHPDSGPLQYYPGSHRLPYLLSREAGIDLFESQKRGRGVYTEKYEPRVEEMIETHRLEPSFFTPGKGDVLFWHHNLIHGGSSVNDITKTRKSLVCHYFSEGTFAYHDLTNTHADVKFNGRYIGGEELAARNNQEKLKPSA